MKRSIIATCLALAFAAAPTVNAKGISYSYIEANYLDTELDVVDGLQITGSGFGVNGSIAFGDSGFYGLAAYESIGEEIEGVDIDTDRLSAGFGYALKIDETLHAIGELAYLDYDFGISDGVDSLDASADGYRASLGLRGMMADNIEGIAKVGYQKVEEGGVELYDGVVGDVGIRWHLDPAWSVGLNAELADSETTLKLGMRLGW